MNLGGNEGSSARSINRGSYMSAHVLFNLLNALRKRDKMRGLQNDVFYPFSSTRLINSIIREHECYILFIT